MKRKVYPCIPYMKNSEVLDIYGINELKSYNVFKKINL